jgi:hypothetical protein
MYKMHYNGIKKKILFFFHGGVIVRVVRAVQVPDPPKKPLSEAGLCPRSRRPMNGTYHYPFSGAHWACQIRPFIFYFVI